MDCEHTTWPDNTEYLRRFRQKTAQQRVPVSGGIALTHRCNLNCVHCYLGPQETQRAQRHLEMDTTQVLSIIDQITAEGCLFLLITGGDPLLRKDFGQIYRHARTNGLLVTVFTNGTLVTDEILELFTDLPPNSVEITLLGATAETFEKITQVEGSYRRCLDGIERLLGIGVNLKLKTILMTLNRHEFFAIKAMAEGYGCKFRFDAAINPCFSGDQAPLALRVSPEEAISKEIDTEEKVQKWSALFERFRDVPLSDALYQCGSGLTNFYIDARGNLQPCLMAGAYQYNLLGGSFADGWREFIPRIREKRMSAAAACRDCEKRVLCGFCPPFFALENGSEETRSDYLCAMGRLRFEAIAHYNHTGQIPLYGGSR